jgi:hypothetical protein
MTLIHVYLFQSQLFDWFPHFEQLVRGRVVLCERDDPECNVKDDDDEKKDHNGPDVGKLCYGVVLLCRKPDVAGHA